MSGVYNSGCTAAYDGRAGRVVTTSIIVIAFTVIPVSLMNVVVVVSVIIVIVMNVVVINCLLSFYALHGGDVHMMLLLLLMLMLISRSYMALNWVVSIRIEGCGCSKTLSCFEEFFELLLG